MIKAVIFDLDGTLVNTREWIYQAYKHTLKQYNLPVPSDEVIARQVGKKLQDVYAVLAPGFGPEGLLKTHRDFQSHNLHLIQSFAGCTEMLQTLHQEGVQLTIFTSRLKNITESLEKAGINPALFSAVINESEVQHAKPHPEGVETILAKLDVSPSETILVGDAEHDILSGKNGGVATIGITHGFGTKEALEKAGADYIVSNLQELLKKLEEL